MFRFFHPKIVIFLLIYASLMQNFAASAPEESSLEDIKANFMKLNEKIDFLNEKMDKMGANPSTGNGGIDVDEIKTNNTKIMNTIEQVLKKIETFEKHFNKIDELDLTSEKIEKLLFEFIEGIVQNANTSETIENKIRSQCISICRFKPTLEKLEPTLNEENKKALNVCDPNPCLNGGRCEVTNGSDFQCRKCPYPMSGLKCENVSCNSYANHCFRRNDTVYVAFEGRFRWNEANQECVKEGMSLAMPKDKDTNEFLRNELKTRYGRMTWPYFWIGLSRGGYGSYVWTDGSLLGNYTGGANDFKTNPAGRCAIMYLDGKNSSMWAPQPCQKYYYYPLCEKRIFVL